jgi:hypothetical protein
MFTPDNANGGGFDQRISVTCLLVLKHLQKNLVLQILEGGDEN